MARAHRDTSGFGRLQQAALYGLMLAISRLVWALPEHRDRRLGSGLFRLVRPLAPGLNRRVRDNLDRVYGNTLSRAERQALAGRIFDHWGQVVIEFFRLAQWDRATLRRRHRYHGVWRAQRAVEAGEGLALITAHYGNFEVLAAMLGGLHPTSAIARPVEGNGLEQFIHAVRARHNVSVIAKHDWRQALRRLRQGGWVGILVDQAVFVGGLMADFLGHPAPTAIGPVVLTQQGRAVALPTFVRREPDGRMALSFHRPLELVDTGDAEADLQANVERINAVISAVIRHRPEEWYWFHRRWKTPKALRQRAPQLRASVREGASSSEHVVKADGPAADG